MTISSELDPLEPERAIFNGEGVETDIRRDFSSGLTADTGAVDPERTAGVVDLCTATGTADAERVWPVARVAPARDANGESMLEGL